MGDSYQKEVITNTSRRKPKTFSTTPAVATPELIDEVYASINDRRKLIKKQQLQSAIRHNMAKDLPKCMCERIIWGKMTKLHLQM
jgi:hypothetical protein